MKNFFLSSQTVQKRKPLPKLVYSVMAEKELRQRLKEWNLSTKGDRSVSRKKILKIYSFLTSFSFFLQTWNLSFFIHLLVGKISTCKWYSEYISFFRPLLKGIKILWCFTMHSVIHQHLWQVNHINVFSPLSK